MLERRERGAYDAAPEQAHQHGVVGATAALAVGLELGRLGHAAAGGRAVPVLVRGHDGARVADEADDLRLRERRSAARRSGRRASASSRPSARGRAARRGGGTAPRSTRRPSRRAPRPARAVRRARSGSRPGRRPGRRRGGRARGSSARSARGPRRRAAVRSREPRAQVVEVVRLGRDPERAVGVQQRPHEVRARARGADDEDLAAHRSLSESL